MNSTTEMSDSERISVCRQTVASRHKDNQLAKSDQPASWGHRIVASILQAYKRRVVIRKLNALSDLHLRDIGIERSEIPSFVAKGQKIEEIS